MTSFRAIRPADGEYAPFYGGYVAAVPDGDVLTTIQGQFEGTCATIASLAARPGHRYAAGKWSVREVVGHCADTERIFAYRLLRIARSDETPMASFDENAYVAHARFEEMSLDDLVTQWRDVRRASLSLLASCNAAEWSRTGTASGKTISVRALAWILAGHERHHAAILDTRYR